MIEGETASAASHARTTSARLLGAYEGLRRYDMLPPECPR